jgi:hypothetical protein
MGEDAHCSRSTENKAILKGDPFAGLGSYQAVMQFSGGARCTSATG